MRLKEYCVFIYFISGESVSTSSSARINNGRTLSGVDVLERKKTGAKVDLLFTTAINEMGTAEAGKNTDTGTTKATIEYGVKTPKVMKDMLYNMVTKNKSSLREIKTFGFIISGNLCHQSIREKKKKHIFF